MCKDTLRSIIIFFAVILFFSCQDKSNKEILNTKASDLASIESTLTITLV